MRHKFPKGHPRHGGMSKGYKYQATLEKERAREELQRMVIARLAPMTNAQMAAAEGTKFLVLRDPATGKFIALSEAKALKLAKRDYELVEVWDKPPSTAAYSDLMNRALDKPKDSLAMDVTVDGSERLLQLLDQAKARNRSKG